MPKRPLTDAECEVLACLDDRSAPMSSIASDLGKKENSIKRIAWNAYQKLGVNNRYDAATKHRRMKGHVCGHLRYAMERQTAV